MDKKNPNETTTTDQLGLLCPTCSHWDKRQIGKHYGWGACHVLMRRLAPIVSDSDAAQVIEMHTPDNFGCVYHEV